MILESIQSANNTILDSIQFTNNKQAAKNFNAQVCLLSQYTSQLEQILNLIMTLQAKRTILNLFNAEVKESLQVAVDACGEKLFDHTLDNSTVAALKSSIELCKKNVEISWKDTSSSLSNDVENSLKTLKSLLPNKQEVEAILDVVSKSKDALPGSPKMIDVFFENVNRGKEMIDCLHLDNETEKFINKVRTQQATVADLTPHIMEWLKDNNLTGKIRVIF